MAIANIARILARSARADGGKPVLVIDWDLEAPGLHQYFAWCNTSDRIPHVGVAEYFDSLVSAVRSDAALAAGISSAGGEMLLRSQFPLKPYLVQAAPGIDLMPAGLMDSRYRQGAVGIRWDLLLESCPGVIDAFRRSFVDEYSYCLIDSRTGYSDASSVCTALMPEKLVAVFSPNQQNLDGLLNVLRLSIEHRRASGDLRPLMVFPLASRIDQAERLQRQAWIDRFLDGFAKLFREIYFAPSSTVSLELERYFAEAQIPHVAYYAYGEHVAVTEEEINEVGSLRRGYEEFAKTLVNLDHPWNERK